MLFTQIKQYREADGMAEGRDLGCFHSVIANSEKDCVRCKEDSNYHQTRDQLMAMEQLNDRLHQEIESSRREMMKYKNECETLHQEMQAKSSQVKQYAKEVDRLKKAVSLVWQLCKLSLSRNQK